MPFSGTPTQSQSPLNPATPWQVWPAPPSGSWDASSACPSVAAPPWPWPRHPEGAANARLRWSEPRRRVSLRDPAEDGAPMVPGWTYEISLRMASDEETVPRLHCHSLVKFRVHSISFPNQIQPVNPSWNSKRWFKPPKSIQKMGWPQAGQRSTVAVCSKRISL